VSCAALCCRYFFTHVPTIPPYPQCLGVCHFSEVAFVFHFQYLLSGASEVALSNAMGGYWASFAATHTPSGAVAWPQYNATGDAYLELDTTVEAISNLKTRECDMWARLQ
jgi:carboxylesterase type B